MIHSNRMANEFQMLLNESALIHSQVSIWAAKLALLEQIRETLDLAKPEYAGQPLEQIAALLRAGDHEDD